jgi:hypothetical protein
MGGCLAKADALPDSQINNLIVDMVNYLHRNHSAEEWKAIDDHIQRIKKNVKLVAQPQKEPPAKLIPATYHGGAKLKPAQYMPYEQQNVAGYTMVDWAYADGMVADGGQYNAVVQVYGVSNVTWTCTWTQIGQYNWAWEPAGCNPNGPPTHSFYVAAQINGSGAYGWWQDYSATTYVNMSYGNSGPVLSDVGADGLNFGVNIVCQVVGMFLKGITASIGYIASNVRPAKTFYNVTGQSGDPINGMVCSTYPACNNPQSPPAAWAINLPYVLQ